VCVGCAAQKLDIVHWKQLFMQKVEPIVDERKKLNVQIQAHLPQARKTGCTALHCNPGAAPVSPL
jgi:hypothetical protein